MYDITYNYFIDGEEVTLFAAINVPPEQRGPGVGKKLWLDKTNELLELGLPVVTYANPRAWNYLESIGYARRLDDRGRIIHWREN